MANDSFDSRDLIRAMRSLRDVINGGTGATDDNSRAGDQSVKNKSDDMAKRAVKSAKGSSDVLLRIKDAAMDAGAATAKFALKVKNSGDIDALEEVIDGVAKAAGEFKIDTDEYGNKIKKDGKDTLDKLGKFGKVSNMFIGGVEITAEASKFLLKRLKENRDMFYELSSSSMAGTGGMSEMQDMWLQSGMKSDNWKRMLVDSSENITLLGTTTTAGTENLAKSMNNLWLTSRELRNIGFSEEEMGAAASKALELETKTGSRSLKSVPAMSVAIEQYANQLDTLTRITGQSKEKAADATAAVRENPKYAAWRYNQLKMGKRTEAQLQAIDQTIIAQYQKNESTGVALMEQLAADGGAITEGSAALAASGISTNEIFAKENDTSAKQTAVLNKQVKGFMDKGLAYQMNIEPGQEKMMTLVAARQSMTVTAEGFEQASEDQAKLKAGADEQTDATFEAQQNMSKMYINTNKQITEFLPKFAELTNMTAQGISYLSDDMVELGKKLGIVMDSTKVGMHRAVEATEEAYDATKSVVGNVVSAVSGKFTSTGGNSPDFSKDAIAQGVDNYLHRCAEGARKLAGKMYGHSEFSTQGVGGDGTAAA